MAFVQVPFYVPDDIYLGLSSGSLVRYGGIVRDTTGQIVVHLKEAELINEGTNAALGQRVVSLAKQNNMGQGLTSSILELVTKLPKQNRMVLIGLGIATAAGLIGYAIHKSGHPHQEMEHLEAMPKMDHPLENAMRNYLDAVRDGNLDNGVLSELIARTEELKENSGSKDHGIVIAFTDEQIDAFLVMSKNYTERLAEANGLEINEPLNTQDNGRQAKIIRIQHYLDEQQRIMDVSQIADDNPGSSEAA